MVDAGCFRFTHEEAVRDGRNPWPLRTEFGAEIDLDDMVATGNAFVRAAEEARRLIAPPEPGFGHEQNQANAISERNEWLTALGQAYDEQYAPCPPEFRPGSLLVEMAIVEPGVATGRADPGDFRTYLTPGDATSVEQYVARVATADENVRDYLDAFRSGYESAVEVPK